MNRIKRNILWIDGIGALGIGILVLLFHRWLFVWYGLPLQIVFMIGMINVTYGVYSSFLAKKCARSFIAVWFLIVSNMIWCFICVLLCIAFGDTMTILGNIVVMGEGIYVGVLAGSEWYWRESLLSKIEIT